MSRRARIFPVDIEAIEQTGHSRGSARSIAAHARWQIALEEHRNAGTHEFLARSRRSSRIREVLRVGPAADREQDLEFGILHLQLAQLVEITLNRLTPGVRRTINADIRGVAFLIIGKSITSSVTRVWIALIRR